MENAKGSFQIEDFRGMITAADRHDLPPGGAAEQVNIGVVDSGELTVRAGYREVVFEDR